MNAVAKLFSKPIIRDEKEEDEDLDEPSKKELLEKVLMDPVIFVLMNKTFRKAVNKILAKRKRKTGMY